jgi:predicted AAA+ superfamily ATPase
MGGMPEVIRKYVKDDSLTGLPTIYESIWRTYQDDVEKYAEPSSERKVIKHIMAIAHTQLDKRITFQNFGGSTYKSREVSEALRKLNDARIIQLIYPTTDVDFPIIPDIKKSPRLQFLDTGLVTHSLGIQSELLGLSDYSHAFKGAIIPHIITQELLSLNSITDKKPNFWVRQKKQSSAEVDLVYTHKGLIIPIEIKSGLAGKLKSLHQFINQCPHNYAIRIYGGNYSVENHTTPEGKPYVLMNLPYYLGTKIPDYVAELVSNN